MSGFLKAAAFALLLTSFSPAQAEVGLTTVKDIEDTVAKAATTLDSMVRDPDYKLMVKLIHKAKAVLIIPSLIRAGFIIGGETGNGVLLTRKGDSSSTNEWSYPSFTNLSSASLGLQIGVENNEIIMVIMTERGLRSVLDHTVTLGANASIAGGPAGAGIEAATDATLKNDIYVYSRNTGLYGGGTIKGSALSTLDQWNSAYYKGCSDTSPKAILFQDSCNNTSAERLRTLLAHVEWKGETESQAQAETNTMVASGNSADQTESGVPLQVADAAPADNANAPDGGLLESDKVSSASGPDIKVEPLN